LKREISLFWFRRDLRIEDNHGLYRALMSTTPILPLFILDTDILDHLENKADNRLSFIYKNVRKLDSIFKQHKSSLLVEYGKPMDIWKALTEKYTIKVVYTNHDYEPYAIKRDKEIGQFLTSKNILFNTYKDQVIFEKNEVTKADGLPYTIFTPYSKVWKAKLAELNWEIYPSENLLANLAPIYFDFPTLTQTGFSENEALSIAIPELDLNMIQKYDEVRNIPSVHGTSRLSVHLRFGTISVRKLVAIALKTNEQWLNELIWREFFMQILFHFPQVISNCFKLQYEGIQWRNDEEEFKHWCMGTTGYPIVDAGMRELNETGFMHNRVRMVVASFLTKHLLIDWRWGEAYFAEKLMDYELSANNGNWQWAAGTGCDSAPYFRVFNPSEQARKFDPDSIYIEKWLSPNDLTTPPIVEHSFARNRALEVYKKGLTS
jgi:deoxyribodipyrimidine photo-lyase